MQRLSRLLAFLMRSKGSQPPPFRGCCWEAQSPCSPRARGGVVVRRSPTDRGRRRCAPGSMGRRRQTRRDTPVNMLQHRRQPGKHVMTHVSAEPRSLFSGGATQDALPVATCVGAGPLRGDRAWRRHNAAVRGDYPATRCMHLWDVFRMLGCLDGSDKIPVILFGGVHNFHVQGVIPNHSAVQSIHTFPTSPVFRSRSLKLRLHYL